MSLTISNDTLQIIAWILFLLDFIVATYFLLLNPRQQLNNYAAGLMWLIAFNSLGLALAFGTASAARAGMAIRAAVTPALLPALQLVSLALIRPAWLPGGKRGSGPASPGQWLIRMLYVLCALPLVLTAIDVAFGTRLWFAPPADTVETALPLLDIAAGSVARLIQVPIVGAIGLGTLGLLAYSWRDRRATPAVRRLAGWLLAGLVLPLVALVLLYLAAGELVATAATGAVFTAIFGYAAFSEMTSSRGEWRVRGGQLQASLTAMVLLVALPLFVGIVGETNSRASAVLEERTVEQLAATNRSLGANVSLWLQLNIQALQELVSLPDIVGMDAARQRPILQAMAAAHPHMYLVSTTDLLGMNVARNDDAALTDYQDRVWYKEAVAGQEVSFQILIGRTSHQPALVASMPIKDASGRIVGVGMFAANLTDIADEVQASKVGASGYAYVVDAANQLVAHPDPAFTSELRDMSDSPPVAALRSGTRGLFAFTDEQGKRWRADVQALDRNWGVIVQEPEAELLAALRERQQVSWLVVSGGALTLLLLLWVAIRRALRPISTLTETAGAIAGGDLDRTAHVDSRNEIGDLARAFNSMTGQLRGFIGTLEQRVADRTADLERRSRYLRASGEVGQAVTSILDAEELIRQVADMILDRFGLYYVGLFLVDDQSEGRGDGKWAVLHAGTGEAGRAMLDRGHRIRVGQGMVGWSIAHAEARVAMEAGADAVRLATPELPETRSEAALPLRSRGRVLGALTVQSTQPGAFDRDALTALQTMADQVAVALDNARLFAASQAALDAAQQAYGEMSRQAWRELLHGRAEWGYRFTSEGIAPAAGDWPSADMDLAVSTGQVVAGNGGANARLSIPLRVRDQVVGVVSCQKQSRAPAGRSAWSDEEMGLLTALLDQVAAALESARLFQDSQRRAAREKLAGEVTARMRETLDIDTVLQTAVREIGEALGIADVEVRMRNREAGEAV